VIFLLVMAVLGAAALGLGLITLPILLSGSGPLTALVRPDVIVVFGRGRGDSPTPTLIATKRFVFVVHDSRLPAQGGLLAWLAASSNAPAGAASLTRPDGFETLCRMRLSDPCTSVAEVEHAVATNLSPEGTLELATLSSYRIETKRKLRGFHFLRNHGAAEHVGIKSQADALALQRFLAPGW